MVAFLWGVAVFLLAVAYWAAFEELLFRWETIQEYSHGYFIPLIALFLAWQKKNELANALGFLEDIREDRQQENRRKRDRDDRDMPLVPPCLAVFPGVHRLSPKSRNPCRSHHLL